jgi:hypothetical protein
MREMRMPFNERQIKSQMKVGAGLALFGLVCPFFWLSLFSGNSGFEAWVYGVHSGIFDDPFTPVKTSMRIVMRYISPNGVSV